MTIAEIIRPNLQYRAANVAPNYTDIHHCPQCQRSYYCADRYVTSRCEPKAYCAANGMVCDDNWTCLPCAASVTDDERALWYRANGID